ncbi:receptor-like protein kinase FERONIA [Impatiens glandulifera]|uniref:receptor-like protein kinase FERONIA n=1 Tax=Impatiens glandulifera TaxID=253017 RepID=UPI001FB0D6C2|nr:receptor-like protein kinase FERONIA [Impatiens glandulifera]
MNLTPFSSRNTFFLLLLLLLHLLLRSIIAAGDSQHAIAVNCGSLHNSTAIDGRQWVGETDSSGSIISFQGSGSKSVVSSSSDDHPSQSLDPTPYMTARASRSSFTYTFHVGSGYKFIRLHFYPEASYSAFKRSDAFFTVKSGPYTLLNNFCAFLAVDSLNLKSIVKEFTLYVPDDGKPLSITFSPSKEIIPSDETFAFVNGIEVVPMPLGLYYTMEGNGDAGAYLVGQNYRFPLGKDTAMEMAYRLNVGGIKLSSVHDPSMFREWTDDSNYIMESSVFPINSINRIKYTKTSKDGAPQRLYQSSWSMKGNLQDGEGVSFTWKLPVDLGFRYLIRLHFCELDYDAVRGNEHKEFNILINNHMVESKGDLIKWGGEIGVAIHKDYLTTLRGDRMMGKRDLVVALYPNNEDQSTEFIDSILKGIEVFKLSNTDDNLAGGNPVLFNPRVSTNRRHRIPTISINEIIILYILIVVIVHQLCEWKERSLSKNPSLIDNDLCRRFSYAEIISATKNFDKKLEIGHGGFGMVYKGDINVINGKAKMTVAIKRLDSKSKQGEKEFISEIEMLSKLRHKHIVSLIGYCNDGSEMILVYEYMERGTLADHLHKNKRGGSSKRALPLLTWKERLNICLGAARGLDYLHNNSVQEVIHRDVKSNNILVDLNWTAKMADFGLCKVGSTSYTHISTEVKGTTGYIDPMYYSTKMLTKKSDVYSFGVVLWEALCGRPALDNKIDDEQQHSLVLWVQHCYKNKTVHKIIDSSLMGQISTDSLQLYIELAIACLHEEGNRRPAMAKIKEDLEYLLSDGLNFLSASKELFEEAYKASLRLRAKIMETAKRGGAEGSGAGN